ncbi:MAG: hypothetical protein HFG75_11870 [Hungatella sp.]|nr:hypothetical protein [Hungatella sp.]
MNQETRDLLDSFSDIIRQLTVLTGQLSQVEEAKAEAASEKRHELLDGFIQKEQAQLLKLRGLEQHRMKLAKNLGWDSLTFRQILDRADSQQREVLLPLFTELEQQLNRLIQSRKASEHIINVRIHEIETLIALQEGSSYAPSRSVSVSAPSRPKMKDTYG